jgi:predicted flap endonuclease-1-like 5' DNA nuclease
MSVARQILRQKEHDGIIVPYIKESGFVVYTTPSELERKDSGTPKMLSDALADIAASSPKDTVMTEEMGDALAAAATPGAVKPSKLARMRREAGEKKERKDRRPEVVVEPLESPEVPSTPEPEKPEVKKEEKPKKAPAKKKPAKKEEKPKKAPTKKKPAKKEEKPKKAPAKKKPAKKEDKPKKAPAKKKPAKKEDKPKKAPAKKTKVKKPELTDIDGVGPATAESLKAGGFKTVASLSKASIDKLSKKVDGVAETTATQYIESAKKLMAEYEKAK